MTPPVTSSKKGGGKRKNRSVAENTSAKTHSAPKRQKGNTCTPADKIELDTLLKNFLELSQRVQDLETARTANANKIRNLESRLKANKPKKNAQIVNQTNTIHARNQDLRGEESRLKRLRTACSLKINAIVKRCREDPVNLIQRAIMLYGTAAYAWPFIDPTGYTRALRNASQATPAMFSNLKG